MLLHTTASLLLGSQHSLKGFPSVSTFCCHDYLAFFCSILYSYYSDDKAECCLSAYLCLIAFDSVEADRRLMDISRTWSSVTVCHATIRLKRKRWKYMDKRDRRRAVEDVLIGKSRAMYSKKPMNGRKIISTIFALTEREILEDWLWRGTAASHAAPHEHGMYSETQSMYSYHLFRVRTAHSASATAVSQCTCILGCYSWGSPLASEPLEAHA